MPKGIKGFVKGNKEAYKLRGTKRPDARKRLSGSDNPAWRGGLFSAWKKLYLSVKKKYCENCKFIAIHSIQLDVDHIDGNRHNNKIENLQTLCANCHRLKTLLNKDNKAKYREIRNQWGECKPRRLKPMNLIEEKK